MKRGRPNKNVLKRARALVPTTTEFVNNGGKIDTAQRKREVLTLAAENLGDIRAAVRAGTISVDTLRSYLADPLFTERLAAIQSELSGAILAPQVKRAFDGDLEAAKFTLPALSPQFDSGIRRESARAKAAMVQDVWRRLLDGQGNPALTTDNVDYKTSSDAPNWAESIDFDESAPSIEVAAISSEDKDKPD